MSPTPGLSTNICVGGTAAGVLVGRLAATAPSLRILLLESGPPTQDNPLHKQPSQFIKHLAPSTSTVRFHVTQQSDAVGGRPLILPTGQCLGGGSSINFMMYTRASRSDFDDWETEYGNTGWGSNDLIPLLKKTETYQAGPVGSTHGTTGPLKVSYGGLYTNVGKDFLKVAKEYDTARQTSEDADVNDMDTVNVYGRWQKWIDRDTGTRSDVPHHFLYPQASNKNLTVITAARVRRVVLDGENRATGVEFTWNRTILPDADHDVQQVKATRLVIVSAGTFGSPGILERSGIGRADVLERIGVKQLVDLPGVGEHYQDHNLLFVPYAAAEEAETLDGIAQGNEEFTTQASEEWAKTGKGIMAHSSLDAGMKMRPLPDELEGLGEQFRTRWDSYFAAKPDKPVLWTGILSMCGLPLSTVPPGKYFSMGYFNAYPAALGFLHATDANDPAAPVDIQTGFLQDMADVRSLMWGYKHTRELARRMPLFRGEPAAFHPPFSKDSAARLYEVTDGPIRSEHAIAYTEEDDRVLEAYTRALVMTSGHGLGTCSMRPREQGGVVDSSLNVYNVHGLKIADLSICPSNVGANTYSTALVVGEKAAVIVAVELGIAGV
ncbi:GMC oxidoreductase [Auriscalpium vulgare]|uniref:GMC oxidoreductase n=1 Tax=Auriscalpium vulgare TaxID=40419 RepID=A0ACB8RGD3_9AGAM|nr:GMC oxidoreductase [Auriscalpium vulgare]